MDTKHRGSPLIKPPQRQAERSHSAAGGARLVTLERGWVCRLRLWRARCYKPGATFTELTHQFFMLRRAISVVNGTTTNLTSAEPIIYSE